MSLEKSRNHSWYKTRSIPKDYHSPNSSSQIANHSKKSKFGLHSKVVHSYKHIKEIYKSPHDEHRSSARTERINEMPPAEGSPSLVRSQSDWCQKDKDKKFPQYTVPPATAIISGSASATNTIREHKLDDNSRTTSVLQSRVGKKVYRIDIENLIPLTVSRYISYVAEKTNNSKFEPPKRLSYRALHRESTPSDEMAASLCFLHFIPYALCR